MKLFAHSSGENQADDRADGVPESSDVTLGASLEDG